MSPGFYSLIHWLFRGMLFNFHMFLYLSGFLLLFFSSFILLWYEMILGIISIFLNLLRLVLWPNLWSLLDNVPYALEIMCILLLGGMFCKCLLGPIDSSCCSSPPSPCNLLSGWSIPYFKWGAEISYYYCITTSPFILSVFASYNCVFCVRYSYNCYIFLVNSAFIIIHDFFSPCDSFWRKVYFVWYMCGQPCCLLVTNCMEYLFPTFHFQSVYVLISEVSLL